MDAAAKTLKERVDADFAEIGSHNTLVVMFSCLMRMIRRMMNGTFHSNFRRWEKWAELREFQAIPRNGMTRLPERVSLRPAALGFGVRWLDAVLDFASALAFQTAVAGTERKKPNQSGVEPPHSKEAYRPMGHGKAKLTKSGRLRCPQKEFGRNACQWQDPRDTMRGSRDGGQQHVGRMT